MVLDTHPPAVVATRPPTAAGTAQPQTPTTALARSAARASAATPAAPLSSPLSARGTRSGRVGAEAARREHAVVAARRCLHGPCRKPLRRSLAGRRGRGARRALRNGTAGCDATTTIAQAPWRARAAQSGNRASVGGRATLSVRGLPLAVDGIPAHRPARTQARTLQDWTEKNQKACVQSGRAPDAARSPQSNEQKSTPEVN